MIFLTLFLLSAHAANGETQPVVLVGDSVLDTPILNGLVEQDDFFAQLGDGLNMFSRAQGSDLRIPTPEQKTVLGELQTALGQNYNVINNAKAGWTGEEVVTGKDGFKPLEQNMQGAIVIVSIGGNDFWQQLKKAALSFDKEGIVRILESSKNREKTMIYQKHIMEEIKKQNPKQIIASLQYDPSFENMCSPLNPENFGLFRRFMSDTTQYYEDCKAMLNKFAPKIKETIDANRAEMINWYKENGVTIADLRKPIYTANIKFDGLHLNNTGITLQCQEYKNIIDAHENKVQDRVADENKVQDRVFELVD